MKKCQCDKRGRLFADMAWMYDKKKELPFVDHEPNKCKCKNELKLYIRNGEKLYLCSNCNLETDKEAKKE